MQRDQDGATERFSAIHRTHNREIRAHLQGMIRDADTVEDLAQETFLRAWRGLGDLRNSAATRAWLYRIATNCALNHIRRARTRTSVPLVFASSNDDEEDIVPAWMIDGSSPTPAEQLARQEEARALSRAVDDLPPGKQRVVHLVHTEGLSIREAARVMGVPEGTVKSRLHYALRQIEGTLKSMEES